MNHGTMKHGMALAIAMGFAAGAQALPLTLNFSYGDPIAEHTTEILETGLLGLFDSSLGTLTGATLDIFGSATTTITLANSAAQNQTARATAGVDLLWSTPLLEVDDIMHNSLSMFFSTGSAQSYAPGQSRSFGGLTADVGANYDLSPILGSLQAAGGGTFAITCESVSSFTVVGGGGNVDGGQVTTAGCGARIAYTYEPTVVPPPPVPEPGSLALFGLGIAAAGTAAVRRKA